MIRQGKFIIKERSVVYDTMIVQDERKTPTTGTHEGKDAPEDWRQKK
jgi:hypothetical protein